MARKKAAVATANRSQAIRDYLAANGNQSMKEIKEGLSAQGIEVSEALVSKVKYRTGGAKKAKKSKRSRAAASNGGDVNKSEAIRDAYKELGPKTRTKDIVAALAEKGINVAPAQVSTVKAHMKTKRKAGRGETGGESVAAPSKRSANGSTISAEDLLAAKRLADQLGGVERLKSALAVLDQLK